MLDPEIIPESFDAAVELLTHDLSSRHREEIEIIVSEKRTASEVATMYHHTLGRWIRNEWKFWANEGPLYDDIAHTFGLWHPDDMSDFILKTVVYAIRGEEFDRDAQIAVYKRHWESLGKTRP